MNKTYDKKEDNLKIFIADFLNKKYPNIPFTMQWDHLKLPISVAVKLKRMRWNKPDFVWPDIFICAKLQSVFGRVSGLFLEVKKNKEALFDKNGFMRKNAHIIKQNNSLILLRELNYAAEFVWSPEVAAETIDRYLSPL